MLGGALAGPPRVRKAGALAPAMMCPTPPAELKCMHGSLRQQCNAGGAPLLTHLQLVALELQRHAVLGGHQHHAALLQQSARQRVGGRAAPLMDVHDMVCNHALDSATGGRLADRATCAGLQQRPLNIKWNDPSSYHGKSNKAERGRTAPCMFPHAPAGSTAGLPSWRVRPGP